MYFLQLCYILSLIIHHSLAGFEERLMQSKNQKWKIKTTKHTHQAQNYSHSYREFLFIVRKNKTQNNATEKWILPTTWVRWEVDIFLGKHCRKPLIQVLADTLIIVLLLKCAKILNTQRLGKELWLFLSCEMCNNSILQNYLKNVGKCWLIAFCDHPARVNLPSL